jgi:lipase
VRLLVHEWGDRSAPPVVCLHGVNAHGGRFRKLAEERLAARYHVLAPDLRGHGQSGWEGPFDLETYVADLVETVDERIDAPAPWIGHSFGGRLILELAAAEPGRISRAALLDPALYVPPDLAQRFAEDARSEPPFATVADAVEARLGSGSVTLASRELLHEEIAAHAVDREDGLLDLRRSREAVAAAYLEMAREPPAFAALDFPTLLLVAERSKLVSAGELELLRGALGERLAVALVPGGHIVLWDAFPACADRLERFLAG